MNKNLNHPLLFLTALRKESEVLQNLTSCTLLTKRSNINRVPVDTPEPYLLETGPGKQKPSPWFAELLDNLQPGMIINYGICGLLDTESGLLENFLIEKTCLTDGSSITLPKNDLWDMLSRNPEYTTGTLLTVDKPVLKSAERTDLFNLSKCPVVDMEGYFLAEIAAAHQLPLLMFKCTSDYADETTIDTVNRSVSFWQNRLSRGLIDILNFFKIKFTK